MKNVIKDKELKSVIAEAVNLICNAVGSTLGPSGNNVLINTDEMSPYITNDGVTIARAIESEDIRINTVLEIIKEASLKTNEIVGDGTTTTLVLLQAIIKEGLNEIELGKNPIILKKELNEVLNKIITTLKGLKKKPTKKDLISIASISANDKELGLLLSNIFLKMKNKYAIRIEESNNDKTYYEIKKGYTLEVDNISNLYFKENEKLELKDTYILILRGYLSSLEQISDVINEGLTRNKNILILASDFDESLNEEVMLYYLSQKANIFLFKLPDYGSRKETIEEDISILSASNIKNISYENIFWSDLGYVKNIIISKEEITLINDNDNIKKRIKQLKYALKNTKETYEKEFLESRISKLEKGIATIYVGAPTKTECREKMMRVEDGLCAIEMASHGIIPGEGICFLRISEKLSDAVIGEKVMKKALQIPFEKIMNNAGEDFSLKKQEIKNASYEKLYNFKLERFEDANITDIIDPVEVAIEAVKNATSIASMLLTTNYLVINENLKLDHLEI